jgi:hypothetical protein
VAVVNSNAENGRRLRLGLASDAPGGNPKLDVSIAWASLEGKSVTLVLDLVLREGNALRAAKNAGNASHTVTCTLENLPLVTQP